MNEKSIRTYKEILEIFIHYIPFSIGSVLAALVISNVTISPLKALMVVLVPLTFYGIRKNVKKPIVHFLLHLLVVLLVFVFPFQSRLERIWNVAAAVIYLCFSLSLHTKQDDMKEKKTVYQVPAPAMVGIIVAEYFIAIYLKKTELLGVMATETVLLILCYFCVSYMTNYLSFFQANHAAAKNMPKGKMLKEGGSMTLVFTLASTAILFLCAKASFLDNLFTKFLLLLRRGIRFLISLIPENEQTVEVQNTVTEPVQDPIQALDMPQSDPSFVATTMDQVVKVAAVVIFVFLVVALIVSIVMAYLRAFDKKGDEDEIKEYIKKEKETKLPQETGREKKSMFDFLSAGERIRHIYAKTIQSRLEKEKDLATEYPVAAMTARELKVLFGADQEENYLAFAKLYEKARYSPSECRGEDVSQAKRLAKQILG